MASSSLISTKAKITNGCSPKMGFIPKNGFVGAPQWSSQGPADDGLAQITAAEVRRSLSGTAGPGLPVAEILLPAASLRSPRPAARDRVVDGLRHSHRSGQPDGTWKIVR